MHKVDIYLLKNSCYIFLLANVIAYVPREPYLFPWMNLVAIVLCLTLVLLIRLTVKRYSGEFGIAPQQVKDLLGKYIEDDKRGKISFYDYIRKRQPEAPASTRPG